METSFRLFAEECDHLQVNGICIHHLTFFFTLSWQGIQVTSDNGSFGGFTHSFLAAFRDEFPRLSSLTFSVLSNADGDNVCKSLSKNLLALISRKGYRT